MANEVKTKFTTEDDELKKSISEMKKEIEDFHKEVREVGKTLREWVGAAIGAATIAEFIKKAYEAAREWNKAQEEYSNALLKTGIAANTTKDQVVALADAIQRETNFSNEQAVQAGTVLSAYQKLNSDGFERTLKLSADLAGLFGGSMSTAAKVLGSALNDPKTALETLHTVGIDFDEDTQRLAATMAHLGDEAGLEELILGKLEDRFGNLAEEAKNTEDPLAGMKNALNDMYVQIGEGLVDAFKQLIEWVSDFGRSIGIFDEASDKMTWFEKAVTAVSVALSNLKDIYKTFSAMASGTAMMPLIANAKSDLKNLEDALEVAQKNKKQAPNEFGVEQDPEVRRIKAAIDAQKQYLGSLQQSDSDLEKSGGEAMERLSHVQADAEKKIEDRRKADREKRQAEEAERERQKNMTDDERAAERAKKLADRNAAKGGDKSGIDAFRQQQEQLKQQDAEIDRLSKDDPTGSKDLAFHKTPAREGFQASIEGLTDSWMRMQAAAASRTDRPEDVIKDAVETVGQAQAERLDRLNEIQQEGLDETRAYRDRQEQNPGRIDVAVA